MTDQEVLKELQIAFEYTYLHEDWVTPLSDLLDGLTISEALWRPTPDAKCIWEIVLHLAKWNQNIIDRIEQRQLPPSTSWPPLGLEPMEEDWQRDLASLNGSFTSVAQILSSTSLDTIQASRYGLADLLCRFTHAGYHIGQITKLRQWYLARGQVV